MQLDEGAGALDPSNDYENDSCGFDPEGLTRLVDAYAVVLAEIDARWRQPTGGAQLSHAGGRRADLDARDRRSTSRYQGA